VQDKVLVKSNLQTISLSQQILHFDRQLFLIQSKYGKDRGTRNRF
jgi:hypothetical protein